MKRFYNRRKPLDGIEIDAAYKLIEDVFQNLAAEGVIYDTGKRRWSERTGRYQIVWALKSKEMLQ
jgi:hypothetical protein